MTHLSKFIFGAQRQKETVVGVHSPEAGHFFFPSSSRKSYTEATICGTTPLCGML